jgi:hypothetical protein
MHYVCIEALRYEVNNITNSCPSQLWEPGEVGVRLCRRRCTPVEVRARIFTTARESFQCLRSLHEMLQKALIRLSAEPASVS